MSNQDNAGPLKFVNIVAPLVGFVCYFMWKDQRPLAAKEMLKWAIGGIVFWIVFNIFFIVIGFFIGLSPLLFM
tara:strand:+ start:421 stop:639 length:219 start_codon:yes stop_codon:yes gene_type:complete